MPGFMPFDFRALRVLCTLALAVATAAPAGRAQAGDPFAPGTRWIGAPTPAAPWLPVSVDFAAGGELVFAASALGSPGWLVYTSTAPGSAGGAVQPASSRPADPATLANQTVRCADGARELFGIAQIPDPDSAHRRTEVARFDALAAGGIAAAWTHDLGWRANGAAKLAVAADGSRAVAVLSDATTQQVRIDWLDGATGALLARVDRAGGTLRQVAASEDATRLAFVAGLELVVLELGGAQSHHEVLAAATQALALSGDGSTLLVGAPGALRVLAWDGAAFRERSRELAAPELLPVRLAVARDGGTWAAGWWNAATGRDVRLELRAAPGDALVFESLQTAPAPAPQNYPESVCVSRDGSRAAFGLWGSLDAQPEVVLVDRATGASVAQLDLPGSVTALALDPNGTRLAIAMKHAHANQFATTGEVRLFDTGERDLQEREPARAGRPLAVTARRAGAGTVWFLYGPLAAVPRPLAGLAGVLALRRTGLRAVRVPADAAGRADGLLPLPAQAPLSGVPYGVQALFRSSGGSALSDGWLEPLML